ncbi:hypothetical protein RQP54_18060 [Curvibacter sp. APW13]|uniref:hypothetical protein n=1 Tax=Curvibacter sp. APW13 TaxID=3077236 RepID=UPI0028DED1F1|nr:hypothetical protein [Curvibacter sp. APW13]MDT8992783.1 hypothetical protein [Curvibacter sp. APW13]
MPTPHWGTHIFLVALSADHSPTAQGEHSPIGLAFVAWASSTGARTVDLNSKQSLAYCHLDWPKRLAIMNDLESVNSVMYQGFVGDGFTAAIGRGALAKTNELMEKHGFAPRHAVTFPLGSDQPAQHLRHDGVHAKACNWLLCTYTPISSALPITDR